MARLAGRRTRTPESDDEEESRPGTPLSTAPNDRKRARRQVQESDSSEPEASEDEVVPSQRSVIEKKPIILNGIPSSGHQPGAIVRMTLKNFVTYTSAEFFPGPSLNMIIGPNGTGKSTFVCAICLGLGWSPSFLGRAKDPAEFVKHGCREATIEIELQKKSEGRVASHSNTVITRIIRRDGNKSKFMINGSDSSQKAVQSLCKSTFDIQIDNLCQFLPQDRVVEFAMMSPIEVLASTQRAAGTPDMLKNQENLKQLRAIQKELMQSNKGDRERLENLERRQEMNRAEVERMREREVTKKKLAWLEQCKPIPEYLDAKAEKERLQALQAQLQAEEVQLEAEVQPIVRTMKAKQSYQVRMNNLQKDCKREVAAAEKDYDEKLEKVNDLDEEINDLQQNYEAEAKSAKKNREEKAKHQNKIAELELQQQQKPPEIDTRAMNQDIKDRRDEIRHLSDEKAEADTRRAELKDQGSERQRIMADLKKNLERFDTQAGQRESQLSQKSKDTFDAWQWIQNNRNLFEKHVYGPPMVECSLKDPKIAAKIESVMQESDFKIITVQTIADFKLLQQKLNVEMGKHDVSLRTCSDADHMRFRRPIPDDELESYGLSGYVIDQLEGPGPVLAMLCHERLLHSSGIASGRLSDAQHERLQDSDIKSYVTADTSYRVTKRAEYGKEGNINSSRPLIAPKIWTTQSVDMGRKAAMSRELQEVAGELEIITREHSTCQSKANEIDNKVKILKAEIAKIEEDKTARQTELMAWNALPVKIQERQDATEKIDTILNVVAERLKDVVRKQEQILLKKAAIAPDVIEALTVWKDEMEALLKAEYYFIEAMSDHETFVERNGHVTRRLEAIKAEVAKASNDLIAATERATNVVREVRALSKKARAAEKEGEPGFFDLLQEIGGYGDSEKRWDRIRLEAEIDSKRAVLDLTEGGSEDAIRAFEDRARQIEALQKKVTELDMQKANHAKAIQEVRAQWETPLEELVAKISDSFSDSFSRIGCAGQVEVYKASSTDPADCTDENGGQDNGLDFANWAIHISVKFRENEPLSLLDSHRQSGGERAVSTIFYLMALQSLSRAPFRVVDEINQGMDPRNERMVHGRMVDVATGTGGSQYFLVTPKLLTGLKYKRGMTVLCIVSGEHVPSEDTTYGAGENHETTPVPKMDFMAFCRKARELNMAGTSVGRRVDSGVGLEASFGSASSVEVGA
jgi:structural maintenance of chromosomes protein 5